MSFLAPNFSDISPLALGEFPQYQGGVEFTPNGGGLEDETTRQFIPETWDQFRPGQSVFFVIETNANGPLEVTTALRLRPWWLRPARQFRSVGPGVAADQYLVGPTPPGTSGVDVVAFGPPDISIQRTNRLWMASPKRYELVAPFAPAGLSYSQNLDDVWEFPLEATPHTLRKGFYYPALGHALAFTSEYVTEAEIPTLHIVQLSWMVGATHAVVGETSDEGPMP